METILEINQLHKNYGPLTAVDHISFKIKKGHVYGILGPNGSGKSTTLGMVLNVVNPTSGDYKWFEGTTSNHDALKRIGAIIERPNFYPSMSAIQNLKLVCKIKNIDPSTIEEKLTLVDLLSRKHSPFKTYSLGMKQRLAIASALLNNPEILILDEPTNGLDPQGIRQIRDIIQKIAANGTTILLASHLLDEVEKVCTDVVVLRLGKMLYSGPVDEMNRNHGSIFIDATDRDALHDFLKNKAYAGTITVHDDGLEVKLYEDVDNTQINKEAFENGIVLNKLFHKKQSLEDQFIELTNQN
ncbi:ABC transporter ATP-binding protein [Nonlabens sp. MB-3u-79]|jgi:ABC-type multidrug transport system ATPase subunit|uniref:ABC transporter ATP-binding protein n=1 Tax=Nonlabens sp. MB-3u-79 TaxID=2058134 RepID=UPI000C311BA8|nr:ATP-binding cassette domain-containing protein [Nonlabens sp. MB-3u-79]AUC79636.1 ABC transporter ATP-binding protein [Nonlabens sp. MB-3u-79]|tara:strand:+ start:60312 stop:61208 length:897 start_codon:yes stop_codon:yes gene_type:complete